MCQLATCIKRDRSISVILLRFNVVESMFVHHNKQHAYYIIRGEQLDGNAKNS